MMVDNYDLHGSGVVLSCERCGARFEPDNVQRRFCTAPACSPAQRQLEFENDDELAASLSRMRAESIRRQQVRRKKPRVPGPLDYGRFPKR